MLIPNNIKEMREEKDLLLGNPKMKHMYSTVTVSLVSANNRCLISHTACYGTYLRGSCGKQMMDGVDIAHVVLPGREVTKKKHHEHQESNLSKELSI